MSYKMYLNFSNIAPPKIASFGTKKLALNNTAQILHVFILPIKADLP